MLRWQLTARPKRWPRVAPVQSSPPPRPRDTELVFTWIGHATFLLQSVTGNILFDPVFSERASPLSWLGPRRVHPPGWPLGELPRIDAVLLSHDHYDHCDVPSLRALATKDQPTFIAPLRHRDLLTAAGARRVVELDWWGTHELGVGFSVQLTPTQHWSNRFGTPRNHRLWGGFFVTIGERRVWFVGDTGHSSELFNSIRDRCGRPDVALIPIGAYEPRWFMAPMHLNPTEAVQLHASSGTRISVAMHWGTFQLSDEGYDDPVRALAAARSSAGITESEFRVLTPGESLVA